MVFLLVTFDETTYGTIYVPIGSMTLGSPEGTNDGILLRMSLGASDGINGGNSLGISDGI